MTLDTVHLQLADFTITGENELTVQPAPYLASTGESIYDWQLFTDTSGKEHTGAKAYLNKTDRFQLTLLPYQKAKTGVNCFVQFSVPKVHNGNNFYSVGEEGSQAVFTSIEKELWQAGIHTELNNAELCRVDTFKNIEPEEEFPAYAPLFGLLKMRRGVDRVYPESFLLKNTQQQFCVYDKIAEMKHRKVEVSHFPAQAMRFEHRCMSKGKVQAVFGFSKAGEMFKSGRYETVKKQQVQQWKNSLFSHSVEEVLSIGAGVLQGEMELFKQRYERNWFDRFLKSYGAYHLAQFAGAEVVRIALQNIEEEKTKVWRAEKLLLQAQREIELLKNTEGTSKTLGTLYLELKEKVCLN